MHEVCEPRVRGDYGLGGIVALGYHRLVLVLYRGCVWRCLRWRDLDVAIGRVRAKFLSRHE